jgi:hypothetical protein
VRYDSRSQRTLILGLSLLGCAVSSHSEETLHRINTVFEAISPYARPSEAEQKWKELIGGQCESEPEYSSLVCKSTSAIPGVVHAELNIDTRNKFVSSLYFRLRDRANRPSLDLIFAKLPGNKGPFARRTDIPGAEIYRSNIPGGVYEVNIGKQVKGYVIQREMNQLMILDDPQFQINCASNRIPSALASSLGASAECREDLSVSLRFQNENTLKLNQNDNADLYTLAAHHLEKVAQEVRPSLVWVTIASILRNAAASVDEINDGGEPFIFGAFYVHSGKSHDGRKFVEVNWQLPEAMGE